MRRFLAILCTLVILCSSLNLAVFAADGVTENAPENTVVLEKNAENLVVAGGSTLDLNGYSVNGLTVSGGEGTAVYLTDSATDDYSVADGVYGKISGTIEGTVLPGDGYMQVTEEDGISFHCVNLEIYAMTLRPDAAGVYYTSHFAGDEVVAAQVESYGVALSVKGEPTPGDKNCGYSIFSDFKAGEGANASASGTLLKNILKTTNPDASNIRNANMEVYGRAYLKTADGYVFGGTVSRSLKEQVEAVDAAWATLQAKQKASAAAMYNTYSSVMAGWNIPNMVAYSGTEIQPGLDGEITLPISVTAENGVVTEEIAVSVEGISVTVPAGVKLAESATSLTLKVTPLETTEVSIDLTDSQVLMPVDVHVDGISAENTVPLTIGLGKVMAENLNMGTYTVYHVENSKAGEMTLISADQPFTAHNQYKYTLDGELTLHMATFSEVAVVSDTNNYWQGEIDYSWYDAEATELYIRSADQLAGFNKIVSGDAGTIAQDGFEGKTVTLISDIAFEKYTESVERDPAKLWYPIGYWKTAEGLNSEGETWYEYGGAFQGIFNGNGHTVSNIFQRTWDMDGNYDAGYWKAAMGLFGYVYGGTVQNLTVDNFYSVGEFASTGCVATCAASTATFENISLTNSHPQAYNVPVSGIVGYVASDDGNVSSLTFKNITVDNSNTISALWGTYDACCAGILATTRANTEVLLENCHVAAKMDVYNDVCANYQYYWYRGSGMLVGGIRKVTNGAVDISGITTKNCTVDFGDWNNYYYCEFEKNGNPSYCNKDQDFKFSRITEDEYTVTDDTAVCNHEHTEKEDNKAVFLPFYQLFAGRYDSTVYGIRNISVYDTEKYDTENVTVTTNATNAVKFEALVEANTEYMQGSKITLGELFEAYEFNEYVPINDESVWANAVDTATGYDVATFTPNKEDWTQGTLTFSEDFTGSAKITVQDYQFCIPATLTVSVVDFLLDANNQCYCKACDQVVTWTALSAGEAIENPGDGVSVHYYVNGDTQDVTAGVVSDLGTFMNVGRSKICLQLNGHNLITKASINMPYWNGTVNVLGSGAITYTGGSWTPSTTAQQSRNKALFTATNGTVNLYGGTFIDTDTTDDKPIYLGGTNTNVDLFIHNGVKVYGTVKHQKMRTMSVSGDCYIDELILNETEALASGAKFTVNSDFTGTIRNFSFPVGLVDGVIANSAAEGFAGTITTASYEKLEAVDGKLAVTTTLDAQSCGKMYCQACDKEVQWWPYLGNGVTLFRNTADVFHHHIYLTEDVVYTGTNANGNFIFTNENLCLNLNGHNITGINAEGESVGLRTLTTTHALNIMGEGTITAGKDDYESGAVIISNGTASEIPVTIYEGVVLEAAEGVTAPVITGNGDVTLYGTVNGAVDQQAGTLTIGATGAVEAASLTANAKLVIAEGWKGSLVLDASVVLDENSRIPAANAEVMGELTGSVTSPEGIVMDVVDGQLGLSKEFHDEAPLNYCEHCQEYVEWTALLAGKHLGVSFTAGEAYHYYVDGSDTDVEVGAHTRGVLAQISSAATVCLNLNNHNMISKGNIFMSAGATLSIMGDGTVTYTGTYAGSYNMTYSFIRTDRAYVNLYGGTYVSTDAAKSIYWNYSTSSTLTVCGDARVEGVIDCVSTNYTNQTHTTSKSGTINTLTIDESAYIQELKFSGTNLVVNPTFTGTVANISFADGIVTDNVITGGVSTGAFTGTITTTDGKSVVADNGGLKIVE